MDYNKKVNIVMGSITGLLIVGTIAVWTVLLTKYDC